MERDGVETTILRVSKEVLVIVGCHICGCKETGGLLRRSSTTTAAKTIRKIRDIAKGKDSHVQGTERVPTSDFTSDEEVVFPECGGTLSNTFSPYCGGTEGDLSGLVDSNRIKVKSFQRQTGEVDQPVHDTRLPFSEPILH